MRRMMILMVLAALTACGGGTSRATGDVGSACVASDRSAASHALCSCVQDVADQTLSPRDQSTAAVFFSEPQLAQDTRQSDRISDEAFWLRYKSFSDLATQICQPANLG